MPVDVSSDILIARPREVVAGFFADPPNAPQRDVNIKSGEWRTPRPLGVGSRIAFVAQFLGRRLAYTYEVIELALPDRFVMRTAEGPFPMETSYIWQPVGLDQTRMTLRNRGAPAGFSRIFAPFMSSAMRRVNRKDLQRLKDVLEAA